MKSPKYYECECSSIEHILRMTYFNDTSSDDLDFLYVEVHLKSKPFFQRLWRGIRYIFGFRSRYGDFDEFCWSPETAKRFADHCQEYLNHATSKK